MVEKLTPARRRELTRNALVDAAAIVFARRGFDGASLDEIAETAGFTRGAIYKNFRGKDELFLEVFDRTVEAHLAAFGEQFARAANHDAQSPGDVAAAWRASASKWAESFALLSEFRLFALRNDEARARYLAHHRKALERQTKFIEQFARDNGVTLRLPARDIARIMDAATEGFEAALVMDPSSEDLYESFLALVLPQFRAEPDD